MKLPSYPVYVISKGRYDKCLTAKFLIDDGTPFKLVVEPHEQTEYASRFGDDRVLVLPFGNLGLGSIPARNWVKDHATASGAKRHWILDDNISYMMRRFKAKRFRCQSGPAMAALEDFTDRYENIAITGMNYVMFCPDRTKIAPFYTNNHVYSCLLILNEIPHRWRGRYNEDTDICLQVLADGWCTVLTNAFLIQKMPTMVMKGGNSEELYKGDGRLKMARSLERAWPYVVSVNRRFKRPQHKVRDEWKKFDTPLKRRADLDWASLPPVDDYGLELRQVSAEIKSDYLRGLVDQNPSPSTPEEPIKDSGSVFNLKNPGDLDGYLKRCASYRPGLDYGTIRATVLASIKNLGTTEKGIALEKVWYDSLLRGEPDYSIYESDFFIGDVWTCWVLFSRKYLLSLTSPKSLPSGGTIVDKIAPLTKVVADLGNGFGYSTAALKELFPEADVYGTNIRETLQWSVASEVGSERGFSMVGKVQEIGRPVDFIFASEYFEHIQSPVEHLEGIIKDVSPKAFVFANAFNAPAVGHFKNYLHKGGEIPGSKIGRTFAECLRSYSFTQVKTKLWNNRPSAWIRDGNPS